MPLSYSEKVIDTRTQQLEAVVLNSPVGYVVLDTDDRVVFANPAAGWLLGTSPESLVDTKFTSSCITGCVTIVDDRLELQTAAVEWNGQAARLVTISGMTPRAEDAVLDAAQAGRNAAVNRLGTMALRGATPAELQGAAAAIVCEEFGVDCSTVLAYDADKQTAKLVAGVGWSAGIVGQYIMPVDDTSQAGTAILARAPVIVSDWRQETRFPGVKDLRERGVISGINVVIPGDSAVTDKPWGVLGAHATWQRRFVVQDIDFMQGLANVLAQALRHARNVAERQESDMLLRAASRTAQLGGWEVEPAVDRVVWSEGVAAINGLPATRTVLTNDEAGRYTEPESRKRAGEAMQACLRDGTHFDLELKIVTAQGQHRWVRAIGEPVYSDDGRIVRARGALQDITDKKQTEEEINFLALYDALTRLPNRRLFEDHLHQALAACRRTGRMGALMLLDLDNFKSLNDTLGHYVGDRLLQKVARRLRATVCQSDTVARFGGDEFVIIINNLGDTYNETAAAAQALGHKLLARLKEPYNLGALERFSTQSIGVTLFGDSNQQQLSELLKQADMAMYNAKAGGRDRLTLFDSGMQDAVNDRVALEAEIRQGLKRGEFEPYYQPQVNMDGEVVGAEVLVRWRHPERGMVSPAEFIPLAEETHLILPLGRLILKQACEQLVRWARRPDTAALTLSVNVSAEQFHHPDFVSRVVGLTDKTGVNRQRLVLELTESSVVKNIDDTAKKMAALERHGLTFSLDDFGTGYSSLYYLKNLPLAELKIDQSFVRGIHEDADNAAIAHMVMALSQTLGLRTLAEGVESQPERDALVELGCGLYQGFFFARPLPIDRFEVFLAQTHGYGH